MVYLHSKTVLHRDLAARNVLLSKDLRTVKVADFGMAREQSLYKSKVEKPMAPRWAAPEVLTRRIFSEKSDVWALAVVFWEIFTFAELPYGLLSTNQAVFDFLYEGKRLKKPEGCPESLYKLMMQCWAWNQGNRPNFDRVQRALNQIIIAAKRQKEEEKEKKLEEEYAC